MLRIAIGLFLSLIATQALADPCQAIPDKGPRPGWAKAGFVVTGAARGIGAAIAKQLANAGASLTLIGRNADSLHALAGTFGPDVRVHIEVADVSDARTSSP